MSFSRVDYSRRFLGYNNKTRFCSAFLGVGILLENSGTSAAVSTASCDALTSCSPAECSVSTDADCTFNTQAPPWSTAIRDELPCKTCTVSTNSKCASALAAAKTSHAGSSIQAVYCNDEYLVIAASGLPLGYDPGQSTGDQYLKAMPLPPGGNGGCRVRSAAAQLNVFKIPLSSTPLAAGAANTVTNPLPNVPGMPAAGAVAVAIDGVPMFPNYNNRGKFTWTSCEVDRCNAHSGKGEDYHYHGDFFGAKCLYTESDYGSDVGTGHPPLIGWALDGYEVFGRYTRSTQQGQGVARDSCGGHEHAGVSAYHYHPEVDTAMTTNSLDGTNLGGATVTYTAYKLAPMECWKGNVGLIPNFWTANGKQALYDSTKLGTLTGRADVEQLKPCCTMESSEYYLRSGLQFSGLTAGGGTPTPSPSPTPTPAPAPTTTSPSPASPSPTVSGSTSTATSPTPASSTPTPSPSPAMPTPSSGARATRKDDARSLLSGSWRAAQAVVALVAFLHVLVI